MLCNDNIKTHQVNVIPFAVIRKKKSTSLCGHFWEIDSLCWEQHSHKFTFSWPPDFTKSKSTSQIHFTSIRNEWNHRGKFSYHFQSNLQRIVNQRRNHWFLIITSNAKQTVCLLFAFNMFIAGAVRFILLEDIKCLIISAV